jgi:transcriptional regulator with GAF, ATPase, and Fis domain
MLKKECDNTMLNDELEKLRLEYQKLQRSFEILMEVTKSMISTLELDELLETLLKRLVEVTNADAGVIARLEKERNLTSICQLL